MKTFPLLAMLLGFLATNAQGEFAVHDNGLIYSEKAVSKLKHIVDSLNLKFKVCEPKQLYSLKQGRGHFVSLSGRRAKEALRDIEAGISLENFTAKYPRAEIQKDLLLLSDERIDYDGNPSIVVEAVEIGETGGQRIDWNKKEGDKQLGKLSRTRWVSRYSGKDDFSGESVVAFFVTQHFASTKMPEKYARMIQYSDCLIDTASQVFYPKKAEKRLSEDWPPRYDDLLSYRNLKTSRPNEVFDYEKFQSEKNPKTKAKMQQQLDFMYARDSIWEARLPARIDSLHKADPEFRLLLEAALLEAKQLSESTPDLEDYVGRYISLKEALELKRHRRVFGMCSMDSRPRVHAQEIALLAAETTSWEIFLRAHLDIMNDRFDRMSDGSYAWKARQTYIKEIEVLDINVPDLIFGISLRAQNLSDGHYFSRIGRTGRALAESKDLELFENRMLEMVADRELDLFNRLLVYYMLDHYNHNLKDRSLQKQNLEKLRVVAATFPDYVSSRLKVEDYKQE